MRGHRRAVAQFLIFAVTCLARPYAARGQANTFREDTNIHFGNDSQRTACAELRADQPAKAALRLVCLRERLGTENITLRNVS